MVRAPITFAALSVLCLVAFSPALAAAGDPSPWPWLNSSHAPPTLSVVPQITEATVSESENVKGLRLAIAVTGEAKVAGWTEVHIVPVYYPAAGSAWPSDKVYDFVLYGREPGGMAAQVITKVTAEANFPLSSPESIAGIRIYGSQNCIYMGVTAETDALAKGCRVVK